MLRTVEAVSLGLNPVVFFFCFLVLIHYVPAVIEKRKAMEAKDWLILGICVGFAGKLLDNIYWSIAWSAHYFGFRSVEFWMSNGFLSNVSCRQLSTIGAGCCHVVAAIKGGKKPLDRPGIAVFSLVLFAAVVLVSSL